MTPKELLDEVPSHSDNREPALATGSLVGGIVGAIALIVTLVFHKQLSSEQLTSVTIVVSIFLPVITAWLIRSKVWSPASVAEVIQENTKQITVKPAKSPGFASPDDFFKKDKPPFNE